MKYPDAAGTQDRAPDLPVVGHARQLHRVHRDVLHRGLQRRRLHQELADREQAHQDRDEDQPFAELVGAEHDLS